MSKRIHTCRISVVFVPEVLKRASTRGLGSEPRAVEEGFSRGCQLGLCIARNTDYDLGIPSREDPGTAGVSQVRSSVKKRALTRSPPEIN